MKFSGRVVEDHGNSIYVQLNDSSVLHAKVKGSLLNESYRQRPTIGDWVEGEVQPGDWFLIERVLDRRNLLMRIDANGSQAQKIAANVDYLWVLSSLNDDFNLNRIERFVSLALEFAAEPVIVLTKTDQCEQFLQKELLARERFPSLKVVCTSVYQRETLAVLLEMGEEIATIALVGSSGVGKTSLINALLEREAGATQAIRESDSKGRHTTTHRSLFRWKENSWLLDSPGVRSLALTSLEHTPMPDDLCALIVQCKFSNCSHTQEPHCAVLRALSSGDLSADAWMNYQRMKREADHFQAKQSKAFASERKEKWKKVARQNRERNRKMSMLD